MNDKPESRSASLSRRSMLQNLALTAGGAAMAVTTLGATRDAAALAKASQKVVAYQDTPKGAQRCDNCRQFEPPSSCKVVDGTILPSGWCKVYVKNPAA